MKTVHKYKLEISSEVQSLELPEVVQIRYLEYVLQDRAVQMWVEVDADAFINAPKKTRRFKLFNTGDGIPDHAQYVGTALDQMRPESWHVYELIE